MEKNVGVCRGRKEATRIHMDNNKRRVIRSCGNTEGEGGRVSGRNYLWNQLLKQGEC
jgi:hypothetical protein